MSGITFQTHNMTKDKMTKTPPFTFERGEDGRLYMCRNKYPRWRLAVDEAVSPTALANSLKKAAEFLKKGDAEQKKVVIEPQRLC